MTTVVSNENNKPLALLRINLYYASTPMLIIGVNDVTIIHNCVIFLQYNILTFALLNYFHFEDQRVCIKNTLPPRGLRHYVFTHHIQKKSIKFLSMPFDLCV